MGINFNGKRIMLTETEKKQKAGNVMAVGKASTFKAGANKCFVGMLRFATHPTSWRYVTNDD